MTRVLNVVIIRNILLYSNLLLNSLKITPYNILAADHEFIKKCWMNKIFLSKISNLAARGKVTRLFFYRKICLGATPKVTRHTGDLNFSFPPGTKSLYSKNNKLHYGSNFFKIRITVLLGFVIRTVVSSKNEPKWHPITKQIKKICSFSKRVFTMILYKKNDEFTCGVN